MQAGRYRLGVQRYDFDAGLAPYPLHSHGQWLALSCHISEVRPPARECDLHMSILLSLCQRYGVLDACTRCGARIQRRGHASA